MGTRYLEVLLLIALAGGVARGDGPPVPRGLVDVAAPAPSTQDLPGMFVLAIGVSRYRDPAIRLDFAAKDAGDLARILKAQEGKLYRAVETRVLLDGDATHAHIQEGLAWLRSQGGANDLAVLVLSGHGTNDPDGAYYFLPYEADRQRIHETMVPGTELAAALGRADRRTVVFLDSCSSGNLLKLPSAKGAILTARLVEDLKDAGPGAAVFSASMRTQAALEDRSWGNGAFTKAVVEGLGGQADSLGTGQVTVMGLGTWISARVKALTKGQQTPTTAFPQSIPDFPIAVSGVPAPPPQAPSRRKLWIGLGVALGAVVVGAAGVGAYYGTRGPHTDLGTIHLTF